MIKRLLFVAIIASLFASCGNNNATTNDKQKDSTKLETPKIAIMEFDKKAKEFVEKEVIIEGMVSHTCKEGGKRMFVIDPKNDTISVEVTTEKSFDKSLEGSNVTVTGIVKELRIDEAYLANLEEKIKSKTEDKVNGPHHAKEGKNKDPMQPVKDYREQIKKSGSDHLSFYSLECKDYKVKK